MQATDEQRDHRILAEVNRERRHVKPKQRFIDQLGRWLLVAEQHKREMAARQALAKDRMHMMEED